MSLFHVEMLLMFSVLITIERQSRTINYSETLYERNNLYFLSYKKNTFSINNLRVFIYDSHIQSVYLTFVAKFLLERKVCN